jgi:hypothetical protein
MSFSPRPISFLVCFSLFASSVGSLSVSAEDATKKDHEAAKQDTKEREARKEVASDVAKEKAMFEAFSADFAKFFSCQRSDSDWYLKRFFEQLKFTLAKHPEIRSITQKPEDIEAMMKQHLKSTNPTADKYLKKISEFSVDVSQKLIEARTRQPAPNFDDRLGGARGLLATLGQTEHRKKWDGTLFTKDLPSTSLRTRLCKSPIKALDREKANRITVAKTGYPLEATAPPREVPDNVDWDKVPKAIPVKEDEPAAPSPTPAQAKTPKDEVAAPKPAPKPESKPVVIAKPEAAPKPEPTPKPVTEAKAKAPAPSPGTVSKKFIQSRIKELDKAIHQANTKKLEAELRLQRKKLQEDLRKAK